MAFFGFFRRSKPLSEEQQQLSNYLKSCGIKPLDLRYYEIAITHQSHSDRYHLNYNNERLEFLGDAVLDLIISEYLYVLYPKYQEGELTRLRSAIVNRKTLNLLAKRIDLAEQIKTEVDLKMPGVSLPGNALEALIGAVYLDLGYRDTEQFVMQQLVLPHLDIERIEAENENYKSTLLEWSQKEGKRVSFEIKQTGEEKKEFSAQAQIDGQILGKGKGRSKKIAEQNAALEALSALGVK